MGTTTPKTLPEIIEGLRGAPDTAVLTLSALGTIGEGLQCRAAMRTHEIAVDEPDMLGGTDTGPNPVELILGGLATCQAITYRVWAAMTGAALDDVRVTAEGDIDLQGFFGLDDAVRPGFRAIRLNVELIGPETEERYRELIEVVDRHCPVLDIVGNPVPVTREMTCRTA